MRSILEWRKITRPEAEIESVQYQHVLCSEWSIVKIMNTLKIPLDWWQLAINVVHKSFNPCTQHPNTSLSKVGRNKNSRWLEWVTITSCNNIWYAESNWTHVSMWIATYSSISSFISRHQTNCTGRLNVEVTKGLASTTSQCTTLSCNRREEMTAMLPPAWVMFLRHLRFGLSLHGIPKQACSASLLSKVNAFNGCGQAHYLPKDSPYGYPPMSPMVGWKFPVQPDTPHYVGPKGGTVHRKSSAGKVTHQSTILALGGVHPTGFGF